MQWEQAVVGHVSDPCLQAAEAAFAPTPWPQSAAVAPLDSAEGSTSTAEPGAAAANAPMHQAPVQPPPAASAARSVPTPLPDAGGLVQLRDASLARGSTDSDPAEPFTPGARAEATAFFDQLQSLMDWHARGWLTGAEFVAAKPRLFRP